MKILFIANADITLYLFRKEFIERLVQAKFEVTILCPNGSKLNFFKEIGCTLIDYSIDRRGKNLLKELSIIKKIYKTIKSTKPDYIFTYTIKPNLYTGIVSRFTKIKFIPTITGLGSGLNSNKLTALILKMLYKFSFKKAYTVVFQNTHHQNWFKQQTNPKIHTLLVNGSGVNLDRFMYSELLKSEQTTFLYLGRIMKDKGIDELLQASTILKKKYKKQVVIKIAGFYEENYEGIINQLVSNEVIEYLGFVENTAELIKSCTALVLPSYHEGMSNVLLEAQAIGRPVIASDIPGCIETFIDGVSGLKVNVKDTEDLTNKMEEFHNLTYQSKLLMGISGRRNIEQYFNRTDIVNKYYGIINISGGV